MSLTHNFNKFLFSNNFERIIYFHPLLNIKRGVVDEAFVKIEEETSLAAVVVAKVRTVELKTVRVVVIFLPTVVIVEIGLDEVETNLVLAVLVCEVFGLVVV
jgi:hypothetical protein